MKHSRLFGALALAAALLASCDKADMDSIKIVCTSDVHGNFFPHDFLRDKPSHGSLSRVSSYLNELRSPKAYGDNVVYIDNGDILQGQPTAYYSNTVDIENTHLASDVLNYLKCDVAMLGNHDIETGGPTYQRYLGDLDCKAVGGNILFEDTDYPFLSPYVLVERDGLQIAFLGLTTPAIPNWLPRSLWKGLQFADMEQSAQRWMKHLREHASPDLVIGLFHSGYEGGIVTDGYAENATRAVAERVPGFDAIFYGHDHRARNEKVVNVEGDTVLLINPANNANKVATLDVKRVRVGDKVELVLTADLVDVNTYEPDTKFMETFAAKQQEVKDYVNRRIGTLTHTISSQDAYFGPSDFIDLIHQMQLAISGAQISFAAPLSFNATLAEGDVYVRDMFNLYRYENMLYVMRLKGHEIKDYLEMSYALWTRQMTSPADHLLLFDEAAADGKAPRLLHPIYNFDSAAGILYEVDVTRPEGKKITIKSLAGGKPFDMDATYLVALNSYRGNGGGELLTKGAGIPHSELSRRVEYATEIDLRFYMLNYIEMADTVNPRALNHWQFVPERWAAPAAERDRKLLFGGER